MVLEQLKLNLFIGEQGAGIKAAFVDVYIWGDEGGTPDTETLITSELGFVKDKTLEGVYVFQSDCPPIEDIDDNLAKL